MEMQKLMDILEAEMVWDSDDICINIQMASSADLLSDVLAFTDARALLLTGLVNPQVIRTAEMVDICAICFVRGKMPDEETIRLAKEKGIPLIATKLPMYEACGRLYKHGLPGCSEFQGEYY